MHPILQGTDMKRFKKLKTSGICSIADESERIMYQKRIIDGTDVIEGRVENMSLPDNKIKGIHGDFYCESVPCFLLLGDTGKGKTTFFNVMCNRKFEVSNGSKSCTKTVKLGFSPDLKCNFIDTPGFGDNEVERKESDKELLLRFFRNMRRIESKNLRIGGFIIFVGSQTIKHGDRASRMVLLAIRFVKELYGEEHLSRIGICIQAKSKYKPYKSFHKFCKVHECEKRVVKVIPTDFFKKENIVKYYMLRAYVRSMKFLGSIAGKWEASYCSRCFKIGDERIVDNVECRFHIGPIVTKHGGDKIPYHYDTVERYHYGPIEKVFYPNLLGLIDCKSGYYRYCNVCTACNSSIDRTGCQRRHSCCKVDIKMDQAGCPDRFNCNRCGLDWRDYGCVIICYHCRRTEGEECASSPSHDWIKVYDPNEGYLEEGITELRKLKTNKINFQAIEKFLGKGGKKTEEEEEMMVMGGKQKKKEDSEEEEEEDY